MPSHVPVAYSIKIPLPGGFFLQLHLAQGLPLPYELQILHNGNFMDVEITKENKFIVNGDRVYNAVGAPESRVLTINDVTVISQSSEMNGQPPSSPPPPPRKTSLSVESSSLSHSVKVKEKADPQPIVLLPRNKSALCHNPPEVEGDGDGTANDELANDLQVEGVRSHHGHDANYTEEDADGSGDDPTSQSNHEGRGEDDFFVEPKQECPDEQDQEMMIVPADSSVIKKTIKKVFEEVLGYYQAHIDDEIATMDLDVQRDILKNYNPLEHGNLTLYCKRRKYIEDSIIDYCMKRFPPLEFANPAEKDFRELISVWGVKYPSMYSKSALVPKDKRGRWVALNNLPRTMRYQYVRVRKEGISKTSPFGLPKMRKRRKKNAINSSPTNDKGIKEEDISIEVETESPNIKDEDPCSKRFQSSEATGVDDDGAHGCTKMYYYNSEVKKGLIDSSSAGQSSLDDKGPEEMSQIFISSLDDGKSGDDYSITEEDESASNVKPC